VTWPESHDVPAESFPTVTALAVGAATGRRPWVPIDMRKLIMLASLAACAQPGRIVVRGPAQGEALPRCHVSGELRAEYFAPVVAYARRHLIHRMNVPDPQRDGFAYLIEPGSPKPDHDGLSFIVDARSEVGALAVVQKRGEWRRETRYVMHVMHSGQLTTVAISSCEGRISHAITSCASRTGP
jgi:hypothetical protein